MPHPRHRYAARLLQQILSHSPIAGIIGQRQTGKTTLAAAASREYETLDLVQTLSRAESNPGEFIEGRKHPFTIDECQLLPSLFPTLKEQVRTHPKKGQFILTGSIRFTSRRAIRESLTGRIVNLELLPLSLAETHSEELPGFLLRLLQADVMPETLGAPRAWLERSTKRFAEFLGTGGLPGVCFYRNEQVRSSRFEAQLETLLERDIRLLLNTQVPYRRLKAILAYLAGRQGQPLNLAELAKVASVTAPTVKKLLQAMEAMFLIRSLETERQARPVVFLEDQGMASHLVAERRSPDTELIRGLFACILPQFLYRPETTPIFYQYRTRGGAVVPVAVKTRLGRIGVIPTAEDRATPSALASARSFVASAPRSIAVIAHSGSGVQRISDSIIAVPYPLILSER